LKRGKAVKKGIAMGQKKQIKQKPLLGEKEHVQWVKMKTGLQQVA
jgi:hypothetical protein